MHPVGLSMSRASSRLRRYMYSDTNCYEIYMKTPTPALLRYTSRMLEHSVDTPMINLLVDKPLEFYAMIDTLHQSKIMHMCLKAMSLQCVSTAPLPIRELAGEVRDLFKTISRHDMYREWINTMRNTHANYKTMAINAVVSDVCYKIVQKLRTQFANDGILFTLIPNGICIRFNDDDISNNDCREIVNSRTASICNQFIGIKFSFHQITTTDTRDNLDSILQSFDADPDLKPTEVAVEFLLHVSQSEGAIRLPTGQIYVPRTLQNPNIYTDRVRVEGSMMQITPVYWINHCCARSVKWAKADKTVPSLEAFMRQKRSEMFPLLYNGMHLYFLGFKDGILNTITMEFLQNAEDGSPHTLDCGTIIRVIWYFDILYADVLTSPKTSNYDRMIGIQITKNLDYNPGVTPLTREQREEIMLFNATVFGMYLVPVTTGWQLAVNIKGIPNVGKSIIGKLMRLGSRPGGVCTMEPSDRNNRFKMQKAYDDRSLVALIDDVHADEVPLKCQESNTLTTRATMSVKRKCLTDVVMNSDDNSDGRASDVGPIPFIISNEAILGSGVGSLRRQLPFFFNFPIPTSRRDTRLEEKILKDELPYIIARGLQLFYNLQQDVGQCDLLYKYPWIETRQSELAQMANTLMEFLADGNEVDITGEPCHRVSEVSFKMAYAKWFDIHCDKDRRKVNAVDYLAILSRVGVVCEKIDLCNGCHKPIFQNPSEYRCVCATPSKNKQAGMIGIRLITHPSNN